MLHVLITPHWYLALAPWTKPDKTSRGTQQQHQKRDDAPLYRNSTDPIVATKHAKKTFYKNYRKYSQKSPNTKTAIRISYGVDKYNIQRGKKINK